MSVNHLVTTSRSFKISTIIPVYNVAEYLPDTIDSVLAQSVGFEDNIQLILVDDGSTDNSAKICKQYARKYPDNVTVVSQPNSGVSAARNTAKKHTTGTYIHFLDSDDCISKTAYEDMIGVLEPHAGTVGAVAMKVQFFEEIIDPHPNNYKFESDRIINLDTEPDMPLLHVSSCVFVRDAIADYSFNESMTIAEDARFIADVLSDTHRYAVVSRPSLYYRKRIDGSSAIGRQFLNKAFYTSAVKDFYQHMFDTWQDDDGRVHAFAQNEFLYDSAYRFEQSEQTILTDQEQTDYVQSMLGLVKRLDDRVIIKKRGLSIHLKHYLLRQKYGEGWATHISAMNGWYYFDKLKFTRVGDDQGFIDFIHKPEAGERLIEFYLHRGYLHPADSCQVVVDGVAYKAEPAKRRSREIRFLNDTVFDGSAYATRVKLPKGSHTHIDIQIKTADGTIASLPVQTNQFSGMSVLPYSYHVEDDIVFRKQRGKLMVYENSFTRRVWFEMVYLGIISLNWRLRTAKEQLGKLRERNLHFLSPKAKLFEAAKPALFILEAVAMIPRALLLRVTYRIVKPFRKRPLWLISDRGMAAGDNGEALFRYIMKQSNASIDVRFVLAKKSKDYQRLAEIGPVLNQNSLKYLLLFLLSDKILSSQADVETTNPFIRQRDHYVDLFDFDFIFLQHGIIRDDLSSWLNRFEKNIALFVTSAQKEYDAILHEDYHYTEKQVVLSGLPRYDYLKSEPKGKLILAPTYRKNLVRIKTDKNGDRKYDTDFKKTYYYMFYNNFMNDPRIVEVLRKHSMTGELYLHPVFSKQALDFDTTPDFRIKEFPYDYSQAFREGSLLVSDYSSLMFDFAYLKKPIVYSQYDVDSYFSGHSSNKADFFTDEQDGFGLVTHDYETLIAAVEAKIREGCVMDNEYKRRVDSFFAYTDQNNCQRVYEAILERTVY